MIINYYSTFVFQKYLYSTFIKQKNNNKIDALMHVG